MSKLPILTNGKSNTKVTQEDANTWVKTIGEQNYFYDPPYNKHPYNIYYLLDIISNWNTNEIPDTYRGQPKN